MDAKKDMDLHATYFKNNDDACISNFPTCCQQELMGMKINALNLAFMTLEFVQKLSSS